MSLRARLKRARASFGGGRCSECGLRPRDKGYIVVEDKDPVPELPEVCPGCGRYTRIRIVVVYEDEADDIVVYEDEADEGEGSRK